jgi:hypothetical protein
MTVPDVPPPPPARPPFSTGALVGGLFLSLIVGGIAAFIAGMNAIDSHRGIFGFLIGMSPGAFFLLIGAVIPRKTGFAQGLIIGGCIIALIGGACGAAMVGTSFH